MWQSWYENRRQSAYIKRAIRRASVVLPVPGLPVMMRFMFISSDSVSPVACEYRFGTGFRLLSSRRGVRLLLIAPTAAIEWHGIDLRR